ncbi:MAG TPA: hypothetical protein VFO29_05145 [Candidatus Rubrimentiphilum sp.]|nr:hypothetical protein [Candidatus Rubrimentiphilum sp.]
MRAFLMTITVAALALIGTQSAALADLNLRSVGMHAQSWQNTCRVTTTGGGATIRCKDSSEDSLSFWHRPGDITCEALVTYSPPWTKRPPWKIELYNNHSKCHVQWLGPESAEIKF